MKKSTILFGLAALTLTACSNDEVLEIARTEAIDFSPFVNHSTRASVDLTGLTFKDFSLWGATYSLPTADTPGGLSGMASEVPSAVFINQKVSKNGELWEYSPIQYWFVGASYRFSAVAPYNARGLSVYQPLEQLT